MGAVLWKRQAVNDLIRIARHIATNSAVNAENVIAMLEAKAAALATYPDMGRVGRNPGTRELVVHANYILIYRDSGSTVEIVRVKHAARRRP